MLSVSRLRRLDAQLAGALMSRELLISQAVMAVTIAVVIALALLSEDRGLVGSLSRADESRAARAVAPPLTGFGSGPAAPVAPVMCPGGATSAYPVAVGGLADDCAALLAAAPTLAGDAELNWNADIPITEWTGVVISGSPPRVVVLDLTVKGLSGVIPLRAGQVVRAVRAAPVRQRTYGRDSAGARLAHGSRGAQSERERADRWHPRRNRLGLANLVEMDLSVNRLTGDVPRELGNLANLEWFAIEGNRLTGSITPILENLSELTYVNVQDTGIEGCIPVFLSGVDGFRGGVPVCAE